jgi:hypothetical protein
MPNKLSTQPEINMTNWYFSWYRQVRSIDAINAIFAKKDRVDIGFESLRLNTKDMNAAIGNRLSTIKEKGILSLCSSDKKKKNIFTIIKKSLTVISLDSIEI